MFLYKKNKLLYSRSFECEQFFSNSSCCRQNLSKQLILGARRPSLRIQIVSFAFLSCYSRMCNATIAYLETIQRALEEEASSKMESVWEITQQKDAKMEIAICIARALIFFDYQGMCQSPSGAVDALKEMYKAIELDSLGKHGCANMLEDCAWKLRDALTFRLTLRTQLGNHAEYLAELTRAFGGNMSIQEAHLGAVQP